MAYREVKIYDGPFPTYEQVLSGDPDAPPHPKQVWLQQVQPGEFAVRYKDFKTGLARNPLGELVRSSEICRIFGTLPEARENSQRVVEEHWTIRCHVYDHSGKEIESIFNTREVNKFAVRMYVAALLWVTLFALAGMAAIWSMYRVAVFLIGPKAPAIRLNWLGWCAFAVSGLILGILGWLLSLRYRAARHVRKVRAGISPEEMKRFEELNTLYGSADPAERARFLALNKELQNKVKESLKK